MLTVPALRKQTASLIFLHGSGDSGDGVKDWLDSILNGNFEFPHIKVIFPSAPSRFICILKFLRYSTIAN